MSRELATAREELEAKGKELQPEILSKEEQLFEKIFKKISPIPFEQFKSIEGNEAEADLILKAFDYYLKKIDMVEDIKNQLKTKKFSQKDYCSYIGKSVKTLLNQKDKYANLLQFLKLLQDKYEIETINILRSYTTKNKASNDDIIDNATAILTAELITTKDENALLKEKIKEINYLLEKECSNSENLKKEILNVIKELEI